MTGKRLLVVDDEPEYGELVRKVASAMGYEVEVIADAAPFKTAHEAFDPAVIVLDIVIPGVDGIESVQWLAARKSSAHLILGAGPSIDHGLHRPGRRACWERRGRRCRARRQAFATRQSCLSGRPGGPRFQGLGTSARGRANPHPPVTVRLHRIRGLSDACRPRPSAAPACFRQASDNPSRERT